MSPHPAPARPTLRFWERNPGMFTLALLACAWQLIWVGSGRYEGSYDAFIHIFLSSHYTRDWFSLWDDRWYLGFDITSYPPLVHQLIALLSFVLSPEHAFAALMLATLTAFPVALHGFFRIFLPSSQAAWAAVYSIFLPSLHLHAHIFGQLPFLFSSMTLLFAVACANRYIRLGEWRIGALAVLFSTVTAAGHPMTWLLFGPSTGLAVLATRLRRQSDWRRIVARSSLLITTMAVLGALVVLPHWQWHVTQFVMQRPIPHGSRHNLIEDPIAASLFFWPEYGPLLIFIPLIPLLCLRSPQFLPLLGLFIWNMVLGLGGTTAAPRLVFGAVWEWLTYDRFAFWASITMLPLVWRTLYNRQMRHLGERSMRYFQATLIVLCLIYAGIRVWQSASGAFIPALPPRVDMAPLAEFLRAEGHDSWRYLTLGFGDQSSRLSYLTDAATPDGNYHTARRIPELMHSGIGQLDAAYWFEKPDVLIPFLRNPNRFNLRWIFVHEDLRYDDLLVSEGWQLNRTFSNGVRVFEPRVPVARRAPPPNPSRSSRNIAWGIAPIASFVFAMLCAVCWLPKTPRRIPRE